MFLRSLVLLLLPKCSCDFKYGPCFYCINGKNYVESSGAYDEYQGPVGLCVRNVDHGVCATDQPSDGRTDRLTNMISFRRFVARVNMEKSLAKSRYFLFVFISIN